MKSKCLLFLTISLFLLIFIYLIFNIDEDGKIVYDGGFFRIMQKDGESYMEIYDNGGPFIKLEDDDGEKSEMY